MVRYVRTRDQVEILTIRQPKSNPLPAISRLPSHPIPLLHPGWGFKLASDVPAEQQQTAVFAFERPVATQAKATPFDFGGSDWQLP